MFWSVSLEGSINSKNIKPWRSWKKITFSRAGLNIFSPTSAPEQVLHLLKYLHLLDCYKRESSLHSSWRICRMNMIYHLYSSCIFFNWRARMTDIFFRIYRPIFFFRKQNLIFPLHLFPTFLMQNTQATRWQRRNHDSLSFLTGYTRLPESGSW